MLLKRENLHNNSIMIVLNAINLLTLSKIKLYHILTLQIFGCKVDRILPNNELIINTII